MNRYLPIAPVNVRGVVNGVEYAMGLKYLGPGPQGHIWQAMWPDDLGAPTWQDFNGLRCDELPGHTVLTVDIED